MEEKNLDKRNVETTKEEQKKDVEELYKGVHILPDEEIYLNEKGERCLREKKGGKV